MQTITFHLKHSTTIGLITLLALAALALCWPRSVSAAPASGVVGTGTPASCTEAALNTALAGGGNVTFNCGVSPYTITLTSVKTIAANTTIDGGGKITLSGGDAVKVLWINPAVQLTLNNLTVAHGNNALGGCVLVQGTLNATQSTFENCASHSGYFAGAGGAIYSLGGTVALTDSFVLNNNVDLDGGGIYLSGGQATLNHVSVLNNTANFTYTGSGGGIAIGANTNFVASNSSFSNNFIGYTGRGGGVYVYSSTALLVNTSADNNSGANATWGGGIYAENSQLTIQGGSASGNDHGLGVGGGLALKNSVTNISNAAINGNVASADGGGIYAYLGSLSLNNVTVNNNTDGEDGGGIYLYNVPTTLISTTVDNNVGGREGGAIENYLNTLTLDRVTVSGNLNDGSAVVGDQGNGGGIYNYRGTLIATNATIDHNTSTGTAGGLYNTSDSTMILTNVTVSGNRADVDGGGFYNETNFSVSDWTYITMTNVTVKDNGAANGGGLWNGTDAHNFVYLKNTVIADSNSGGNCYGKAVTSANYSLSTDNTCNLIGGGNLNNVKAQLFPLLNNGGTTKTHLPGLNSPAINSVSGVDFPSPDQRGVFRPQGAAADMGAVERQASDPVVAPWVYLPLIIR